MIRVGVAGFGFMGKMHFRCYKAMAGVKVAALCDVHEAGLSQTKGEAGNISGAEGDLDFTGISLYTDFDRMLAEADLDAVSITLPTYLHAEFTVKALRAGMNVLCEKPMALDIEQCQRMIDASEKSGRLLQIGHCIRFWPEYVKAKQIVDSGDFGNVKAATMRRLSKTPTWSWENWLMRAEKSGGAMVDLHIHDSDFVQYAFGMPRAVFSRCASGPSGHYDHIVTQYIYDDNRAITAEGGWIVTPSFGFEMSFNIILDKATVVYDCTRRPPFKLCLLEGEPVIPEIEPGDGYSREIEHFVRRVRGEDVPEVITPQQSLDSVRLVLAERRSAERRKEIELK